MPNEHYICAKTAMERFGISEEMLEQLSFCGAVETETVFSATLYSLEDLEDVAQDFGEVLRCEQP